ncbi:ATP-grasp domain-containing protein [Bacillus pseudomycoides]|uniref:ATP-grasp domain-containing protein n=1 Tax=Bacillus pseudomycoides TaxID=64104 RepID=UPI003D64B365
MRKQCFITPELRPDVIGAKVKRREWPINGSDNINEKGSVLPEILIIAPEVDSVASYFQNFVRQSGHSVETIHLEDRVLISEFIRNLQIDSHERDYPGIYYRSGQIEDSKGSEIMGVMHDLLTFYPGVVINRPSRLLLNYSKPLQMTGILNSRSTVIKAIPTLLTNLLTELIKAPANETIVKSISDMRSEVVDLTDQRLQHNGDSLDCPVQLQPKLQGINIRVHICGEAVYAVRIDADAVDYRYGKELSMKWAELPQEIESWCVQLAKREGLEFAGIDLLYQEKNDYYWCFEINPMPGYAYFEQYAGGEPVISKWLLQRLLS